MNISEYKSKVTSRYTPVEPEFHLSNLELKGISK